METRQTEREDNLWSQSKSLRLHHKKRIIGFVILILQGLKRIYVAYIFWQQLNHSSDSIIKKPISGEELCEISALTPVLRSGYPPWAAVSLVVLSPTRDGRVCDIQLVIIAMVLSTTPIFSKGTVIFALCLGTLFRLSSFYRLRWDTRETSRVPQSGLLFHPGHRLGCAFFGHLQRKHRRTSRTRVGWPKLEDRDGGKTGKTSSRQRIRCRCWKRPRNSSSLSALSRTVLLLRSTLTISFTPDGPPPALVRSVIKCHWLHTHTHTHGGCSKWMRGGRRRYYGSIFITRRNDVSKVVVRSWCLSEIAPDLLPIPAQHRLSLWRQWGIWMRSHSGDGQCQHSQKRRNRSFIKSRPWVRIKPLSCMVTVTWAH